MNALRSGLCLLAVLLAIPNMVLAHGGGLDALGCHHNRKTGDYHCHRSSYHPSYTPPSSLGLLGSSPTPTPAAPVLSYRDVKDQEKIKSLEDKVAELMAENARLSAKVQEQPRSTNSCQAEIEKVKLEYEAKLQQATIKPAALTDRQTASRQPIRINMNNIDPLERTNIQMACISSNGAANYNRCVKSEMDRLSKVPSLSQLGMNSLSPLERTNIQIACISSSGAAAYNLCVQDQMNQLNDAPRLLD